MIRITTTLVIDFTRLDEEDSEKAVKKELLKRIDEVFADLNENNAFSEDTRAYIEEIYWESEAEIVNV